MAKCKQCGEEFEGKRVDAMYCSDVCRVIFNCNISGVSACVTVKSVTDNSKRGKDIKCFADLPSDVQQAIDTMSTMEGKIDQTIKTNRTAIAINYQHQFPDRYHSRGVI